ncbi:MAG: hypothetical protein JWO95_3650 [Verrucomicrobiales bacterium]|nr:hypothetical protein [Verrucomicrobiales bacterium]
MTSPVRFIHSLTLALVTATCTSLHAQAIHVPTLEEAQSAKRDVWGEAAIAQPNGPSYEFFENLLPPPRYVDAEFKYYPIALSAPNAPVKAHLISNGSGINLWGVAHNWKEHPAAFHFRVGPDQYQFGGQLSRLEQPTLADGYLPIFEIRYQHASPVDNEAWLPLNQKTNADIPSEIYKLEAFAPTDKASAEYGIAFVKFSLAQGNNGDVSVVIDSRSQLKVKDGVVTNDKGQILAWFDKHWKCSGSRAEAKFGGKTVVTLAVASTPVDPTFALQMSPERYAKDRETCAQTWREILGQGMNVETPEPVVNNAWRHLLVQNFELINGDKMKYSTGNSYDGLYEAEGSDAALAMMVWGFESDTKRLMGPLFDFTRKGLEYHQAGFKLNDICRYYWQTRDASIFKDFDVRWRKEADRLDKHRTGAHGLFPEEQYCGDVHTRCQSLNVNSKAWRGLRDLGAALETIGNPEGAHYTQTATEFRPKVLQAVRESAIRTTTPPFVPMALYTNEGPHDPITQVRIGGYWNIIIGYTIASGVFPVGSEEENWIPNYQENYGGLVMGMIRAGGPTVRFWNSSFKINPLYGTRYALDTLRRDDVDRALVCFYGMLAQGFTRNTFNCGEVQCLTPLDEGGRILSLPPNSAANSHLLSMLRYMLVQDYDSSDDGKPDTLRLCFATPKRWMEDGKTLNIERAPTMFGPVSVKMQSHIQQGNVTAEVALPERNAPEKILIRARVPDGFKTVSAEIEGKTFKADDKGTVDLTGLKGKHTIRFAVEKI